MNTANFNRLMAEFMDELGCPPPWGWVEDPMAALADLWHYARRVIDHGCTLDGDCGCPACSDPETL